MAENETASWKKWLIALATAVLGPLIVWGIQRAVTGHDTKPIDDARLFFEERLAGTGPRGLFLRNGGDGRADIDTVSLAVDGRALAELTSELWNSQLLVLGIPDKALNHAWLNHGDTLAKGEERGILFADAGFFDDPDARQRFGAALKRITLRVCYRSARGDGGAAFFPARASEPPCP